jgi:hypothetical protein
LVEGNRVHVAFGETTTELTRAGLYRIGKAQNATQDSPAQTTLRVWGGEALVRSGLNMADAKRGMAVNLDADLAVSRFDRKQTDLFHAWAARRSFDLFMSDPDAIENRNFGVEFRAFLRRGLPPPSIRPAIPPAERDR